MFPIPTYLPPTSRLCTYAIQMLQSWWYINFTYKVMSLLDTAGMCILVMACLLFRFEKMLFDNDCYGAVYNTSSKIRSCISSLLPSSCRSTYSYEPRQRYRPRRRRSSGRNYNYSFRPQDHRRNQSGIHNRRGQYRYFRNKYHRADRARERKNPGSSDEEPSSPPEQPTPSPSLHSTWCHSSLFTFCSRIYYRYTAQYYSWQRRRKRHWPTPPGDLDEWEQVEDWVPTEITNDIALPSHDEYYDINYPFYRTAFVLGHATSPNADILPGNEINPPKVRSGVRTRQTKPTKPSRLPNNALILDSGANIHIINNPSFLSCIRSCIGQWINTTGSRKECKLTGQLCDALKPLPLPNNGYLYQPNNIGNIISLSLLSDSHRITMDTEVENAFLRTQQTRWYIN